MSSLYDLVVLVLVSKCWGQKQTLALVTMTELALFLRKALFGERGITWIGQMLGESDMVD